MRGGKIMEEFIKLSIIDGETLLDMDIMAPRFCVRDLLPQGLSILGGAPKIGKSWLVLDLCLRVAKGESMWISSTCIPIANNNNVMSRHKVLW